MVNKKKVKKALEPYTAFGVYLGIGCNNLN